MEAIDGRTGATGGRSGSTAPDAALVTSAVVVAAAV